MQIASAFVFISPFHHQNGMNISLSLYFSTVFCTAIEQKLFENGILPGVDDVLLVQAEQIQ